MWRETFWLFWAGLGTFVFVLISSRVVFEAFDQLYTQKLAGEVVWRLFVTQLPKLTLDALPGALLFAVFLSAGRHSRELETPAMFWSGVWPARLFVPYLTLGLLLAGLLWVFREKSVIPWQVEHQHLRETYVEQTGQEKVLNEVALRLDQERMLYAGTLDTTTGQLTNVVLLRQKEGQVTGFVTAASASWQKDQLTLGAGASGNWQKKGFEQGEKILPRTLQVKWPFENFLTASRPAPLLTLKELAGQIRFKKQGGLEFRELLVERQMRYSFPFSCVVIVLLTLPLGYRLGRQEQLFNAVLCVFFVSFYWGIMAVARGLAVKGVVEPYLGVWTIPLLAWSQNILLVLLGSCLLLAHRLLTR